MKNIINKVMSMTLVCSFCMGTVSFAESVSVKYSGKAEPDSMVSLMVIDKNADVSNLKPEDLYVTDIKKADHMGNFSKTIQFDESEIDNQGNLINYNVVSNIELTQQVLDENYSFESFTVSPVEQDGVLFVPIEEALDLIGGETVSYTYNEERKIYSGSANNGEFTIVMGEDTVEVDWVDIELPAVTKTINGTNMMPAYAIKYLLKTGDVLYTSGSGMFKLSEGVKEAGYDWSKNNIELNIDSLIDESTRVVIDSSKKIGNLYPWDSIQDNVTLIERVENASEFGDVFTITNTPQGEKMGGTEVAIIINHGGDGEIPFANDHIGVLHFKARIANTADEKSGASTLVQLQRRAASVGAISMYSTALYEQIPINYALGVDEQEWQDIYLMADSGVTELVNGSWIKFIPYAPESTIEICDIQLWDFGLRADCAEKIEIMKPQSGYKGIEDDHVWRQEAFNRIEKYRKEDISVEVTDSNGNPVKDAKIGVKMTENEFMFGTALVESEVLDEYVDTSDISGQKLNSLMENDMNTGVAGDALKPKGIVNTDASVGIKMVNEFLSRGKRVRGHAVLWDAEGLMPFDRAKQMTYEQIYKQTMDYIRPLAYTFKGRLAQWDVINEPHDSNYIRMNYNTTRLYTDIFKEVKKIDPDVKLYVNETGIEGRPHKGFQDRVGNVVNIVGQIKSQGAEVDGIGVQAHCTKYHYPQGFYHQLDELTSVVDEVAVTEYDFFNGDTTHAPNHLEDTLLATFSHPKSSAFIVWGVQDFMHWRIGANSAPFFKRDWTEKPAYAVWQRLINQDFATNTTLTTDAEGKASVRAFRGDYEITCTVGGKTRSVPLGNTVDGGSSVKFVVGDTINATASNGIRVKPEPIEFENMTEAKKEFDSITAPYYKGVILDRNFKDCETSTLVQEGGNLAENSDYQAGKTWGSYSGNTDILYGGDINSVIIHANGEAQSGEIRLKAEGTERYENTELHHETMFNILDADASGEVIIHTGISAGDAETDLELARIIYEDGEYTIETYDSQIVKLDKNSFYTLDTAVCGNIIEYTLYKGEEAVYEHSCELKSALNTTEYDEVMYMLGASCEEGDIFKLHNARLFEYKDGEIIEFSNTDYETHVLDESMKDFDIASIDYLGKKLNEAPKEWSLIGENAEVRDGFGYQKDGQYFGVITSYYSNGENRAVKGFDKIIDGESIEFTFNGYVGAYADWMNKYGHAEIALGSHDMTNMLRAVKFVYTQFHGWNLNVLGATDIASFMAKEELSYDGPFSRDRVTVKLTLTPSESGDTYDADISIKARTGNNEITASYPSIFTAEQAKSLDTIFITSYTDRAEPRYSGTMMLGVNNLKIRKYGKTMYTDGVASVSSGDSASLGIMYNNVTGVYKPATVVVAGYDENNALVSCEVKSKTMQTGKGSFSFTVDNASDKAVKYQVFLVDGADTLRPYKEDDVITVK